MKSHNLIIKLLGTICAYYSDRVERQTGYIVLSNATNGQMWNLGLSTANGKIPINSVMERTPLQDWGVLNINFLYYSLEIALYCYKNDRKH